MAGEEENKEYQSAGGPSKNPLLTLLLFLNAILMIGVAYFQYVNHQKISSAPSIKDLVKAEMKSVSDDQEEAAIGMAKEEEGILFPLERFTANLAQGDGPRRYILLQGVLKFSQDSNEEEFKARKPQIRDVIISILNSKRPEDLLKTEGKAYLKEEIKAAINTFLVDGHVVDIYYVSFQIN